MKDKLKALSFILIALFIVNTSIAQKKTSTEEFLEEVTVDTEGIYKTFEEILASAEIKSIKPGKETKGIIDEKGPIMLVEGEEPFPAPYTIYKIDVQDKVTIDLRALGIMGGFKKVLMFPLTNLYNKKGEKVGNTKLEAYNIEFASMKYPANIRSIKSFTVDAPGSYYLVISADNSSKGEENGFFTTETGISFTEKSPFTRGTYAKLKFTIK